MYINTYLLKGRRRNAFVHSAITNLFSLVIRVMSLQHRPMSYNAQWWLHFIEVKSTVGCLWFSRIYIITSLHQLSARETPINFPVTVYLQLRFVNVSNKRIRMNTRPRLFTVAATRDLSAIRNLLIHRMRWCAECECLITLIHDGASPPHHHVFAHRFPRVPRSRKLSARQKCNRM